MGWTYEVGLVLIGWVGLKVNGLDLEMGLVLISWVELKVNGLGLESGLGPNKLGWA